MGLNGVKPAGLPGLIKWSCLNTWLPSTSPRRVGILHSLLSFIHLKPLKAIQCIGNKICKILHPISFRNWSWQKQFRKSFTNVSFKAMTRHYTTYKEDRNWHINPPKISWKHYDEVDHLKSKKNITILQDSLVPLSYCISLLSKFPSTFL